MNKSVMIFLLLAVKFAFAQERELLGVSHTFSKLRYNDTVANAMRLEAKLRFPLFKKKSNTIVGTVGYENLNLSNFPLSYGNSFHGTTFQLGWVKKLSRKKSLAFFSQAGLFSDMKDISSKDFRYSAGFRYRIKHSEKLSTGWGLAYGRQFFGSQIIPFIDIDYAPNQKWSITGQFPVKPKVMYHFNKKTSAGFELLGNASSYRLAETEGQHRYIQQNQWTGLFKLEYRFARYWQLNVGVGSNLRQAYKLYNGDSKTAWTIITIPLGERDEPIQEIGSRGLNMMAGISFTVFSEFKK
jgi:Domain of unknown function (DUF6268)